MRKTGFLWLNLLVFLAPWSDQIVGFNLNVLKKGSFGFYWTQESSLIFVFRVRWRKLPWKRNRGRRRSSRIQLRWRGQSLSWYKWKKGNICNGDGTRNHKLSFRGWPVVVSAHLPLLSFESDIERGRIQLLLCSFPSIFSYRCPLELDLKTPPKYENMFLCSFREII